MPKAPSCERSKSTAMAPAQVAPTKWPGPQPIKEGSLWNNRYVLRKRLGSGASARVWLAYDQQTSKEVALKHFVEWSGNQHQSRQEINNLRFMSRHDPDGRFVTKLQGVFSQDGRPCLVIDYVPGTTISEEIKKTKRQGVSLHIIRRAMENLLRTFQFLSSSKINMLHGDVKPDNVILGQDQQQVQLIDYGLASFTQKMQRNMYIQSRWYRSPEVLLGIPATPEVDMWSLGCLLVEMFAGIPPFQGRNSYDQMLQIVDAIGAPSLTMRKRCEATTLKHLDDLEEHVRARWAESDKQDRAKGRPAETKEARFKRRLLTHRQRRLGETDCEREWLVDLASRLLVNDPLERMTPSEALVHPFLVEPTRCLPAPSPTWSSNSGSPKSLSRSLSAGRNHALAAQSQPKTCWWKTTRAAAREAEILPAKNGRYVHPTRAMTRYFTARGQPKRAKSTAPIQTPHLLGTN